MQIDQIDKLNCQELRILYKKQTRRLNKIIKRSDTQTKKLFELNQQLEKMAYLDPLTGIYNRRYLFDTINKVVALHQREQKPFSLAIVDIDDFKQINDTYGHDMGDKVIKSLCHTTKENLREGDFFIRFGGEEFILVFPETPLSSSHHIAKRILTTINTNHSISQNIAFSVSIGLTEIKHFNESLENLIKTADIALYKAKQQGKNRVICL